MNRMAPERMEKVPQSQHFKLGLSHKTEAELLSISEFPFGLLQLDHEMLSKTVLLMLSDT